MKGKMVLENKISKIFKIFGVKVVMGNDFMYNYGSVFFTPFEAVKMGNFHRQWIADNFGVTIDSEFYFLFSLLHEIGHHKTIDQLTENDLWYESFCRDTLGFSDESIESINEAYFNLPAEMLATKWALDFMLNNLEWCTKAQHKIYKALRHFGNVNGWEI